MEFIIFSDFEKNIQRRTPIIRWRDLPTDIIYRVKSVNEIKSTSIAVQAMYADLQDRRDGSFRTWLPKRLCDQLKDHDQSSQEVFVRSKGRKTTLDGRDYFDFEIMRRETLIAT